MVVRALIVASHMSSVSTSPLGRTLFGGQYGVVACCCNPTPSSYDEVIISYYIQVIWNDGTTSFVHTHESVDFPGMREFCAGATVLSAAESFSEALLYWVVDDIYDSDRMRSLEYIPVGHFLLN